MKTTRKLKSMVHLCMIGVATQSALAAAQEVGEVFRDCDLCPEMVVVPAGTFMMGSPDTEEGRRENEGPRHQVTIEYMFAAGVYEVTFDEWDACVRGGGCGGHEPDDWGMGRGRRPVVDVHWEDAWQYVDWLTEQTGEEYRLLSEAEWEYVARAGTRTARYWGETDREQCRFANGYDASGLVEVGLDLESVGCRDRQGKTGPVGTYMPNGFGLYDVLGNAREWVDDCENGSYQGSPTDGSSWYSGDCTRRLLRGGAWADGPMELRSAHRTGSWIDFRHSYYGFRVARTIK